MRTGRPKALLVLTPEADENLKRWTRRPKTAPALARRARTVLACPREVQRGGGCRSRMGFAHRGQVAGALYRAPAGGLARRTATRRAPPPQRCPSGARHYPDLGVDPGRGDALEHTPAGPSRWDEPECHQPDWARFCLAASPQRDLQIVAGPAVYRESSGYRGALPPSPGSGAGPVRR